ncbi:uncharacterized protein LOC129765675 [Toxorhynchites rutilus septentrionalis]|uniref:uncharacterized protein LOC129765675 n=1 Tax=Toxorhynchites rutilus septentrionalis TaxID=329112 RepID=UPI002479AD32|nr:uncharacterized protein LOC129765675 [Toxorhynchites rutilus septentrionalis]
MQKFVSFGTNSQKYKETLQFYIFFKKFIYAVEVGHKRYWKPWQASIILATNAILRLQDMFLNVKGYSFLFTARFTQDCVENIFSQIRIRQKKPTALQFKCFLKSLTISQYLTVVSGSSYETDDTDWLLNFPSNVKQLKEKKAIEERKVPVINELTKIDTQTALKKINDNEKNVVYHLAGMIVYKVAKHDAVCQQSVEKCLATEPFISDYTKLTITKDFTGQALVYVNEPTFIFFLKLEIVFRSELENMENDTVFDVIEAQLANIPATHFIECHDLKKKLIRRFLYFRLKIHQPKKIHKNKYDSRSMAM